MDTHMDQTYSFEPEICEVVQAAAEMVTKRIRLRNILKMAHLAPLL